MDDVHYMYKVVQLNSDGKRVMLLDCLLYNCFILTNSPVAVSGGEKVETLLRDNGHEVRLRRGRP